MSADNDLEPSLSPKFARTRRRIVAALTRRERQCVLLLVQGATDSEIASELSISYSTVRFHLEHARGKFAARSRAHLAALAVWARLPRL
jgi:DNA-binding CsgD family transcriptional regulator